MRGGAGGWIGFELLGCGFLLGGFRGFFLGGFSQNLHLDVRAHFAVQLDGHIEFPHGLERIAQLDLAAVNLKAVRSQLGSDGASLIANPSA